MARDQGLIVTTMEVRAFISYLCFMVVYIYIYSCIMYLLEHN